MAYDPLAALLAPYTAALAGEEMNEMDPIYALLQPDPVQQMGRSGTPQPHDVNASNIQEYARKLARQMFGKGQWNALDQLVSHESSWNPQADNPTSTAYGLFQFLDSTRQNYGLPLNASPRRQVQAGLKYIDDRYDDPRGAWQFWRREGYY